MKASAGPQADLWAIVVRPAIAVLVAAIGNPTEAAASAFYIREQSATAMGSAFAGATAGAEDISFMFYNGAGLTRAHGSQLVNVGSLVLARIQFKDGESSTAAGVPVGGGDGGDGAGTSFVPALYGLWDVSESLGWDDENVKLGVAVNSPFGLQTNYESGWIGRYYALESSVRTLSLNPTIAYELAPGVSAAIGLQVEYIKAKLTNAIDFGTLGAFSGVPYAEPTQQDGRARVTGDDIGYGYTAGVLFEPWAGTRFGASFRSAVNHQLDGKARFHLDNAGVGAALSAQSGAFVNTGAQANFTTPEIVAIGAYHALTEDVAIMADVTWTHWSRFRTLRVRFDNPAQPTNTTEEDWRDTWFGALGVLWRPAEGWALRAGAAYDQSPVPTNTRTPRTPANNGTLLAVGAEWHPWTNVALSLGYSHFFIESAHIDLSADGPDNVARGNLSGRSENGYDTISVQVNWEF